MAGQASARRQAQASHEHIDSWMRRRNEHVRAGREAEAAGRKAWANSTRSGDHVQAAHPNDVQALGRHVLGQGLRLIGPHHSIIEAELHALDAFQKAPPIPQANLIESAIPLIGPAWEFAADVQGKRYGRAVLDAAVEALDLPLAKAAGRGLKRAVNGTALVPRGRSKAPYEWKRVREWMGKAGYLQAYQHGHHAIIPQNGWGKIVSKAIKNHPLNIKAMPDAVTHARIHHRGGGLPRFNPVQRYIHGTPAWWKASHASAGGHMVMATTSHRKQPK